MNAFTSITGYDIYVRLFDDYLALGLVKFSFFSNVVLVYSFSI
jgi:hypothetical protein